LAEDTGIEIHDSLVQGGVHQHILNAECPSCSASNVKVMKCQEIQCTSIQFCELCNTNCRWEQGSRRRFDSGIGTGPFCSECLATKEKIEAEAAAARAKAINEATAAKAKAESEQRRKNENRESRFAYRFAKVLALAPFILLLILLWGGGPWLESDIAFVFIMFSFLGFIAWGALALAFIIKRVRGKSTNQ